MRTIPLAPLALLALLAAPAAPSAAPLRSPQVPVSGTALATYLASKGQSIAVVGDQRDVSSVGLAPTTTITDVASLGNATFGLYNASFAVPPLYQIFPGAAANGWFTIASFRTAPTRLLVNLFDPNGAFQGSTTYLAGPPDAAAIGFYAQDASSVAYSQDSRNAGGLARILVYEGTGSSAGSWWLACELSNDPVGDFSDLVMLLTFSTPPVGTKRSTWGRLQQLYR